MKLVATLQNEHSNNKNLQALVKRFSRSFLNTRSLSDELATQFLRQYMNCMNVEFMFSQPMTVGYALRISGDPFDHKFTQPRGITGWMMMLTLEGHARIEAGPRTLTLKPGQAMLFEPGSVFSYSRDENCPRWGYYWLTLNADRTWGSLLTWPKVGPKVCSLTVDDAYLESIKTCLQSLLENFSNPSPLQGELNRNLLEQTLLRFRNLFLDTTQAGIDPRTTKAQSYIDSNFSKAFTVQDIADDIGLSPSALSRIFKNDTGVTLLQWRDEARMIHAARLLRSTALPITQIAIETGFDDAAFFTRTFKRIMACTPKQYRNSTE